MKMYIYSYIILVKLSKIDLVKKDSDVLKVLTIEHLFIENRFFFLHCCIHALLFSFLTTL